MKTTEPKASPSGTKAFRWRGVALFLGVSVLSVLLLFALIGDAETFDQVSGFVQQISVWLMVARLSVILLAWWYWDGIVDWLFRGGNQAGVEPLKAKRHTLALFFVVFELVVVQNVIGHLISVVI